MAARRRALMSRSALVVDSGRTRAALAAVRALGVAGWRVGVASPARVSLASSSRWCDSRHPVPDLADGSELWLDGINQAIEERGFSLVLPAGDAEVLTLSKHRDELRAALPSPSHSSVVRGIDKLSMFEAATAARVSAPATAILTPDRLRDWEFPAVVKARIHDSIPRRFEATVVDDAREAAEAADAIRLGDGVPLLQNRIAGRLMAFNVVIDEAGDPIAHVAQIADRTWPVGAGVSARASTVECDPAVRDGALRVLRELDWRGLAQLQFIVEPDGRAHLVDLNARFYGSLALALGSGVNLTAIWAGSAIGDPPTSPARARLGVRYQWLEGDIRAGLAQGRGPVRSIVECLRFARGATHTVWNRRDPGPIVASLLGVAIRAVRRMRLIIFP